MRKIMIGGKKTISCYKLSGCDMKEFYFSLNKVLSFLKHNTLSRLFWKVWQLGKVPFLKFPSLKKGQKMIPKRTKT